MSHLQIGELLLLVGDGLFYQDTFNALFHSILLCLNHNRNEAKMFYRCGYNFAPWDYRTQERTKWGSD